MEHSLRFDLSSPRICLDRAACILCDRCSRACAAAGHDVVHRAGKGAETHIVFDWGDSMAFSACVSCGACVFACPTGAMTFRNPAFPDPIEESTA
jgi:predicted molibdopterin-dependent oxidoreductase YjgC